MNHTYSHPSFTGYSTGTAPLGYRARDGELRKTESAVRRIAGATTNPYFRPPYGDYDESMLVDVYTRGYRHNVMWSTDSLRWQGLTKRQILQRVLDGFGPGAIYLFHVGRTCSTPTRMFRDELQTEAGRAEGRGLRRRRVERAHTQAAGHDTRAFGFLYPEAC